MCWQWDLCALAATTALLVFHRAARVPGAALRACACPGAGIWRLCATASLRASHTRSCHHGHSTASRYSSCLPAAATCAVAAAALISSPAAAKDGSADPDAGQWIVGAAADTATAGSTPRAAVCRSSTASAAGTPAASGAGTSCRVGHLASTAAERRSASRGPYARASAAARSLCNPAAGGARWRSSS